MSEAPRVRKWYERCRVPASHDSEMLTKQSFAEECDINVIVKRYQDTGMLPHVQRRMPMYGDFSMDVDLHGMIQRVEAAQANFEELSAEVRDRVGNSPERFLEFVRNPANVGEMVRLGLLNEHGVPKDGVPAGGPPPASEPAGAPSDIESGTDSEVVPSGT